VRRFIGIVEITISQQDIDHGQKRKKQVPSVHRLVLHILANDVEACCGAL
jgi:hypothetical protein